MLLMYGHPVQCEHVLGYNDAMELEDDKVPLQDSLNLQCDVETIRCGECAGSPFAANVMYYQLRKILIAIYIYIERERHM